MNREEYITQCMAWVNRIYYASVAMNNEAIKQVVEEIQDYVREERRRAREE